MRRLAQAVVLLALISSATCSRAQAPPLVVPPGTTMQLVVLRPVWAASAKIGDPLYLQVSFPVAAGNTIAIPSGTYAQAVIDGVVKPTRKVKQAVFAVHLSALIFANGYAATLSDSVDSATVTIKITTANDLFFDNGTHIEMALTAPLTLSAQSIAQDLTLKPAPPPLNFSSATLCRPTPFIPGTPGTPATPDTVIPGSPGTPDTVIPNGGGDGIDITIPGMPATPDTVIPGSPGDPGTPDTPATYCPDPPRMLSSTPLTLTPGSTLATPSVQATPSGTVNTRKGK